MKKILLIMFPIILLASIVVLYVFVPSVIKTWFIVRHVLIYMLLAYVIILSILISYKLLIKIDQISSRIWIIRGLSIIVGSSLLIIVGDIQLNLIEDYEIPPLQSCAYYDKYDNLIYSSQYNFICPELGNLEYNYDDGIETLSFTVYEEAYGWIFGDYYSKKLNSSFSYTYKDDYRRIQKIYIDSLETTQWTLDFDTNFRYYVNKYVKIVENEYGDLLSDNGFAESTARSTITEYKWDDAFDGLGALLDIYIPDIENIDPEVTSYEAKYAQIPDEGSSIDGEGNISNHYYDITFKEIHNPDSDFEVINEFATGTRMNAVNAMTYMNKYRETVDCEFNGNIYPNNSAISYVIHDRNESERSIFKYYYSGRGFYGTNYLTRYEESQADSSVLKEVKLDHYDRSEAYYFINESYTAKMMETDFGKKIEYYSTFREEDRTYIDIANSGSDTTPSDAFRPLLYSLSEMHDYKFMLENHIIHEYLIIYQDNFLFFGVPSMVITPT
ncbi:MAG: hypothetical protein ACVCEJ_02915 [Candidatus Izemoplasmataceae bacterium]